MMIKYGTDPFDFIGSYKAKLNNSLNHEVVCDSEEVSNERNTSDQGIRIWENELLTTHLSDIIENGSTAKFTPREADHKYNMRPKRMSIDLFGVSDYWYLILAMNNYNNIYEFKGFGMLLVPEPRFVEKVIERLNKAKGL
jgi:hypothetical protein